MSRTYNDPAGGAPSEIGSQIRMDKYLKKALIEAREKQFFMPLADVTSMPKHMGKKLRKYHYLPLLDDLNVNDQGLDAAGATLAGVYRITLPSTEIAVANGGKAAAVSAINDNLDSVTASAGANDTPDTGFAIVTVTGSLEFRVADETKANAITAAVPGARSVAGSGNLYGSSKDIGSIPGKLPTLGENGGRVNRVGFTRVEVEGTFENYGFFDEYTRDSVDFDTDDELTMHVNREMLNGAHELTEDVLQIDLLNSPGVVKYAGTAVSDAQVDKDCNVTYDDLLRLSIDLDNNHTPKQTKIITGTRMIDTRTIAGGRVMYCGSELQPTLEGMEDLHSNPAFVPVHQYAAGTEILNGEIGSVGYFRIVIVPKMLRWEGAGADASATSTHFETNDKYDIFPMLVVGSESFSTIGFQTDGQTVKFEIIHRKPGKETADRNDPYGKTGFMSIQWWYGFLLLRPERIGLIKTAAIL